MPLPSAPLLPPDPSGKAPKAYSSLQNQAEKAISRGKKALTFLQKRIQRRPWHWAVGTALFTAYFFCLPWQLFDSPVSTVLLDHKGTLLGARIAADGQWRFPEPDSVPIRFEKALLAFEDKRFYRHWGVDPLAMGRALRQNLQQKEVVSGGSTLTMQVIRLMHGKTRRNLPQKLLEMVQATRLEFRYSKKKILRLYAAHAPFGGNVVGLDAAAWKYFGRPAAQLSWAESATLAVLPNAPGLIHPGRRRTDLENKRNRVLKRLQELEVIDNLTYELALSEPLPEEPLALPSHAPHLLERVHADRLADPAASGWVQSTIHTDIQQAAAEVVDRHHQTLRQNGIFNAAALILETQTGNVLAYIGNTQTEAYEHGGKVDIVARPRSSGSILKPFLFAAMLQEGELLSPTLSPDVPTYFRSFSPANFDREYRGAVPADLALARSLNVPAVRWLQTHGVARFYDELKSTGITTLRRHPDHYGLALILGGAETTLWDLAGAYAGLGRTVSNYLPLQGRYDKSAFRAPNVYLSRTYQPGDRVPTDAFTYRASAAWLTLEALTLVNRPEEDMNWEYYSSSRRVAWKTGTSFGFRDAWAVGVTPVYTVAVWVGNADGEGRPDLVGGKAAAPLLFDLMGILPPERSWFTRPDADLIRTTVCHQSGFRPGPNCSELDTVWASPKGEESAACPYHQRIHLDPTGIWRVHSECEAPARMLPRSWFVLPPSMAYYFQMRNPGYLPLPAFRDDCAASQGTEARAFEWVYPTQGARVFVPVDLDGARGKVVFEVAHRRRDEVLYWHLDEEYQGETRFLHQMALAPSPGQHLMTVVDARGNSQTVAFEVLEEKKRRTSP